MAATILVVDDSPSVRRQARLALTGAGYQVIEAADGIEGAARVAQTPGLAAAIVDVNMPGMSGLDMLERIKAHGANSDLPVLMLTTEGQRSLLRRAKDAGAKGWIIKPVKSERLVAAVRSVAKKGL